MTLLTGTRLAVTAFSAAAVQALLIDQVDAAFFRHLDVPLAVAIALVVTRPNTAPMTGFVFGLGVDLFQLRLFGLHGLAYCALGPIATNLPVSALRSRIEVVASLAAVQTIAVTTVVMAGAWLLDGRAAPGLFGRLVQATLWSVAIVLPLSSALGGRTGLMVPESIDRSSAPSSADW